MQPSPVNPYLKTKILTASPEELRLMLYDGALRFCRQAKPAIEEADFDASYHALSRAEKIVLELSSSLKHNVAPDLCDKLNALYTYIYRLLVEANTQHVTKPLEEAIGLLEYERETWQMLMDQLKAEKGDAAPENLAGAQQTAMNTLSRSA